MPANITNVAPASANPGDRITLTGTGFVVGAAVVFAGVSGSIPDPSAQVVSDTTIQTTVPDFGGDAMPLSITVTDPGDQTAGTPGAINLNAWPPVEAVFPLCGLNALKRALGLAPDQTDSDVQLRQLIQIASAQLMRVVTYDIQPVTLGNELYDGEGTPVLYLRHAPVMSVSACSIDGQPVDVSTLKVYKEYIAFDDTGFEYNARLRSSFQIFGAGRQNVSVSYMAGFALVPGDLSDACAAQAEFLRNTFAKQGLLSDTNGLVNAISQYSQLPVAPAARIAANRYRKQGMRSV